MFGYIRPMQAELKVRELERFKACYCGLCHTLGSKYGTVARFILNYEFVFLSMLLWNEDDEPVVKRKCCIASPFKRKSYCAQNEALGTGAGYCVILAWWKLRDTISDEPFIKTIPYRMLAFILSGAYSKAAREFPEFDAEVRQEVAGLHEYESSGEMSVDGAADKFAKILCATVPKGIQEKKNRVMLQLLYHLGRWVYIIDACDDYLNDARTGQFNPVVNQYPPDRGIMPDGCAERLRTTLTHSNNLISSAFELLAGNPWTQTVGNMIYLSMPDVCTRVLSNSWNNKGFHRVNTKF